MSNEQIATEEIIQDIKDTEVEITNMKVEIKSYSMLKDRMSYMRASARKSGIKEREEFIMKLNQLLQERGFNE